MESGAKVAKERSVSLLSFDHRHPQQEEEEMRQKTLLVRREKATQPAKLFLCGFVGRCYHNQTLVAIANELMPHYFVSTNLTAVAGVWEASATRGRLAEAELLLFYMNGYTLKDERCLLTLQYAWELMVPVLAVKHPRLQMVFTSELVAPPAVVKTKPANANNKNGRLFETPRYGLIEELLVDSYRQAVAYNRLSHDDSMERLRRRIGRLLQLNANRPTPSPAPLRVPSPFRRDNNNSLKLPPLASPNGGGVVGVRMSFSTSSGRGRSPSAATLASFSPNANNNNNNGPSPARDRRRRSTQPSAVKGGRRHSKPTAEKEEAVDEPTLEAILERIQRLDQPSVSSTNDESLYKGTQYLVFPMKDKAIRPTLIRFPADVLSQEEFPHLENAWGSDSDIEEEVQIAFEIRGNVSVSESSTPAPYMDDL